MCVCVCRGGGGGGGENEVWWYKVVTVSVVCFSLSLL